MGPPTGYRGGIGKIICEKKVASEPQALVAWFNDTGLEFTRIGLEAGPLSQWLLEPVSAAMLQARVSLRAEYGKLHRMLLGILRADATCRA
jgi:hypothetical protein